MLESLFGNPFIEKVLFFLITMRGLSFATKESFSISLYSFQLWLGRLEKSGIVISHHEGKTLIYQFNPRYPFLNELKAFLEKAYDSFP